MKEFFSPGVMTALVTPFDDSGSIQMTMLEKLLQRQLNAGIRSIVICGTTGESPTLSDAEKQQLFHAAKYFTGGNAKILAGTGSNSTAHAVTLSRMAQAQGADGLLVVSPYYNKATEAGLIAHYRTIAQAVDLPILLYNVPSRTGVNISPQVCRALSQIPNIAGIKEASPDLRKAAEIRRLCPEHFSLWSGNDDLLLPMISVGARGVISVLSNVLPKTTCRMTDLAIRGNFQESREIYLALLPLISELFSQVNPIPVKAAMKLLHLDCGGCRLPLTDLDPACLPALEHTLGQVLERFPE